MNSSIPLFSQVSPVADGLLEVSRRLSAALAVRDAMAEPAGYVRGIPGKLLRPALLLSCASVVGRITNEALDAAVAVELIHTASLVHDDVVDRADLRRGMPAARLVFGDRKAVLLGDYLFTTAFEILNRLRHRSVITVLSRTIRTMSAGEFAQLGRLYSLSTTEGECLEYVEQKTASLMSACCRVGAITSGATRPERENLAQFGWNLGMAYQIADDIRDITGSAEDDGKPPGSDLRSGIVTLPLVRLLADAAWAARIKRLWAAGDTGQAESVEVLRGIHETGALAYAAGVALRYCREALRFIQPFPPSPESELLARTVAVIGERCEPSHYSPPVDRSSLQTV